MKRFRLNRWKSTLLGFERSDIHAFCFLEDRFFEFALAFERLQIERFLRDVAMSIEVFGVVALSKVILVDYSNDIHLGVAHV